MKTLHEYLKETKAMMDKTVADGMKLNQREQGKLELLNSLLKKVETGKLKINNH